MAAATLPYSRSMRVPLSNRQDINEFGAANSSSSNNNSLDDWGPNSVPPSSQSNIPWDDQVVPALRKKLEAESKHISKRISRIEESDAGWVRSRESQERRMSREVVQHHQRESSIDQFHNRFASVRGPSSRQRAADVAASSFPFDASLAASVSSTDATARAREKARQIAARKQAQKMNHSEISMLSSAGGDSYGASTARQGGGMDSSIDVIPEVTADEYASTAPTGSRNGSSFERKRLRTQSTPMRPSLDIVNPPPDSMPTSRRTQNQSSQEPHGKASRNGNGHQRTSSLSRRKAAAAAAMDPKLIEEFGPLGSTSSPTAKLLRAYQDNDPSASPSVRDRTIQPDAFRSTARGYRESSAPPSFGDASDDSRAVNEFGASPRSKSVNDWEDQIIPTVARKMQQERFKEGRFSKYEGLIDTWDRNGLPLSHSDIIAAQKANKLQEEQRQQEQLAEEQHSAEQDGEDEQVLSPGPAMAAQRNTNLSPVDAQFAGRSRSRASNHSRASHRSAHSQQPQQYQPDSVPMQELHPYPQQHQQQQYQPVSQPAPAATQPSRKNNKQDEVDKAGCCCIVM